MSKKLILLTTILIFAFLVSACAAPATPAAPAAEQPAAEQPAAAEQPTEAAAEPAAPAAGEKVTLTIESWRNDDLTIWQDTIIPAFDEQYPDIEVVFSPSAAGRVQRRPERQAGRRHGRRPDHLPPLRCLAGAV